MAHPPSAGSSVSPGTHQRTRLPCVWAIGHEWLEWQPVHFINSRLHCRTSSFTLKPMRGLPRMEPIDSGTWCINTQQTQLAPTITSVYRWVQCLTPNQTGGRWVGRLCMPLPPHAGGIAASKSAKCMPTMEQATMPWPGLGSRCDPLWMRPRGLEVSQHRVSGESWSSSLEGTMKGTVRTVPTASSPWTERSHKLFPLGGGPPQCHSQRAPIPFSVLLKCHLLQQAPGPSARLASPCLLPHGPQRILCRSRCHIYLLFSGQTDWGSAWVCPLAHLPSSPGICRSRSACDELWACIWPHTDWVAGMSVSNYFFTIF